MQSQTTRQQRPDIPDKLYFRIGEVAKFCAVPAYVLRFWEGEFPQLRPNKSGTGQRLYRKRDVETALRIKRLLYDEGYTIAGARQAFLAEAPVAPEARSKRSGRGTAKLGQPELPLPGAEEGMMQRIQAMRTELRELLVLLSSPKAARVRRMARPEADRSSLFEE